MKWTSLAKSQVLNSLSPFCSSSRSVSIAVKRPRSQRRRSSSWGTIPRSGMFTACWMSFTLWWTRATSTVSWRCTLVEVKDANQPSCTDFLVYLIQMSVWHCCFCVTGDPESVAGEYGRHSLYKMLGYFSLVGLLRLHSLLGDYYQAIKVLENIELNKKVIKYPDYCCLKTKKRVGFVWQHANIVHQIKSGCLCFSEHVFTCARVSDHHLLLCWFRISDDETLSGRHSCLRQHSAVHPEDQKHVPENHLQIWDGQFIKIEKCLSFVELVVLHCCFADF